MTVTTTSGTPAGSSTLTVTGTSGVLSHGATANLVVTGQPGATSSIWASTAVPANPLYSAGPVTLGEKFRSDVSGTVSALRFYKGAGNTGTHIGLLYSSSGALLAQATFTNETASGWQQVSLSTPVTIAANTTYVVAYFSNSGFAYDANYFVNTGVDNPPLHALQYGVDGPNGVYMYASTAQFPTNDGFKQNYWADVVFTSGSITPDFTIGASPGSQTVMAGNSTTYTIATTALNGFSGVVGFSATGLPDGLDINEDPETVETWVSITPLRRSR